MFQHWPCRLRLPSSSQQSAEGEEWLSPTHKLHSSWTHPCTPPLVGSHCQMTSQTLACCRTHSRSTWAAHEAPAGRGSVGTMAAHRHTLPHRSARKRMEWCVCGGVPPIPGLSRVTHNARAHQTTRTADTSSVGLGYVGRVPTGPIGHSGPFHITGHPITSGHYRWLWRTVTKGAITCGLVNNLCRTSEDLVLCVVLMRNHTG